MNFESLKIHRDERGDLIPISLSNIPFVAKRIFYIVNVPERTERGGHGHYKCCQYYICIQGIIRVEINDGENEIEVFLLPGHTLLIDKMVWTSEKFMTSDSILLVLCSEEYDPKDYFTDKKLLYEPK